MRYNLTYLILSLSLLLGCTAEEQEIAPPAIDFTGTWQGDMTGLPNVTTFSLTVTQNGSVIAGTYTNNLFQSCSVSGSVSGYDVSMTLRGITIQGYIAYISGTADDFRASGTFSDNLGYGGNWNAIKW